jgi:hypothetical protein
VGFEVKVLGFRIISFGLRVQSSGFRVKSLELGFMIRSLGSKI